MSLAVTGTESGPDAVSTRADTPRRVMPARPAIPAQHQRDLPRWSSAFAGQTIHLIGIGGCGMRGLASALMRCGATVSGSDRCDSATLMKLADTGAMIHIGQASANIPERCDCVVYSAAIHEHNPERVEARRRGIRQMKYAAMLGQVMQHRSGIAVSGTHGKSSTTALLAFILREAGLDPSFVVGAGVPQLEGSAGVGDGPHFVVEACEFDRSFLNLTPDRAAILNIEEDHLDCYPDLDAIVEAFSAFAARVPAEGLIVANGEDRAVARALAVARATVEAFGFTHECTWSAADVRVIDGRFHFNLLQRGDLFATAVLGHLAGRHQIANALAATALAWHAGVEKEDIVQGLLNFRGAHRRMSVRGEGRGVTVIDDYGHHPTEIQATLRAIRERYPGRRTLLVFQPHQHSRTRFLLNDFARCFGQADQVILPDIYFVRDSQAERDAIRSTDLVERIHANGGNAVYMPSFESIIGYILAEMRSGDLVITMGAGDVWKIADELVCRFE